MQVGLHNEN